MHWSKLLYKRTLNLKKTKTSERRLVRVDGTSNPRAVWLEAHQPGPCPREAQLSGQPRLGGADPPDRRRQAEDPGETGAGADLQGC